MKHLKGGYGRIAVGARLCLLTFFKLLNNYQWKSVKGEQMWAQTSTFHFLKW